MEYEKQPKTKSTSGPRPAYDALIAERSSEDFDANHLGYMGFLPINRAEFNITRTD